MKLRVGIPLIQSELNGRGGWIAGFYFIRNCLMAISTLPIEIIPEMIVFVPDSFDQENLNLGSDASSWLKIIRIPESILNNPKKYSLVEEILIKENCEVFFPFLALSRFSFPSKTIGWIPDFQDKYLSHNFSKEELNYRELSAGFIANYCNALLCTSQSVYNDLNFFYPSQEKKGAVVHFRSVIENDFLEPSPSITLKEYNINTSYFYLPNQFWVHKNHKIVFEAYKILKEAGYNYLLVCTGSEHDYRFPHYYKELLSYIHQHQLEDNIKLLGFVPREKQIQLYRGATAILQPSLFEGWSTSIEDAKALGKEIIVSDIAVHREQCGDEAQYFEPTNAEMLADILMHTSENTSLGFNEEKEKIAHYEYQETIKKFGRELVELFSSAAKKPDVPSVFLKLPVLLNNQLMERLTLIEKLDKRCSETSLIHRIKRKIKSKIKKIFGLFTKKAI